MAAALALGEPVGTALAWGNAAGALAASLSRGSTIHAHWRDEIAAQLATTLA